MHKIFFPACLLAATLAAQEKPALDQILERLAKLELENATLKGEVGQLRQDLDTLRGSPPKPLLEERVTINERRIDEQSQTKVESAERFPIHIRGTLLANLFHNGPYSGGLDTPTTASRTAGRSAAGLAFRQSILGLEYSGPKTLWGGRISGSIMMDFFDGAAELSNTPPVRMRTANLGLHWATRSIDFSLDKPLFSLRDPSSFSYVGVSPLTNSGNLWRWQQQIRFEQGFGSAVTGVRAQVAVSQTTEDTNVPATSTLALERRRPGVQGRLAFFHKLDDQRSIEFAPAFHFSSSHAGGVSIPSNLFSIDWMANPSSRVQFTGTFFTGQNLGQFGASRQGFTARSNGTLIPVHGKGGWAQLSFPLQQRITLNLFGGIHDHRNADLAANGVSSNHTGATNLMFRIAPNVFVTIEALQMRTQYLDVGTRKNNRYDLSIAYLF